MNRNKKRPKTKEDIEPLSSYTTRSLAMTALLIALIFVVTRFIQIPIPAAAGGGYLNLGDSFIAAGALLLGNPLAAIAAGAGSALADLTAGFAAYAIPTLLIKGAMALVIVYIARHGNFLLYAIGVFLAGLLMIAGYFAFEYFAFSSLYAFASAPFNILQAAINFVLALLLFRPITQFREVVRNLPELEEVSDRARTTQPKSKSTRGKV